MRLCGAEGRDRSGLRVKPQPFAGRRLGVRESQAALQRTIGVVEAQVQIGGRRPAMVEEQAFGLAGLERDLSRDDVGQTPDDLARLREEDHGP